MSPVPPRRRKPPERPWNAPGRVGYRNEFGRRCLRQQRRRSGSNTRPPSGAGGNGARPSGWDPPPPPPKTSQVAPLPPIPASQHWTILPAGGCGQRLPGRRYPGILHPHLRDGLLISVGATSPRRGRVCQPQEEEGPHGVIGRHLTAALTSSPVGTPHPGHLSGAGAPPSNGWIVEGVQAGVGAIPPPGCTGCCRLGPTGRIAMAGPAPPHPGPRLGVSYRAPRSYTPGVFRCIRSRRSFSALAPPGRGPGSADLAPRLSQGEHDAAGPPWAEAR